MDERIYRARRKRSADYYYGCSFHLFTSSCSFDILRCKRWIVFSSFFEENEHRNGIQLIMCILFLTFYMFLNIAEI